MNTHIQEEDRYTEVQMMFDDMQGTLNHFLGKGFGSRFYSIVVVDNNPYAIAPHVGIFTLWYKGGIFCFLALIVFPAIYALGKLLSLNHSPLQMASAACMATYIFCSCLSGGWSFIELFFFGAFFAISRRSMKAL